MDRRLILGIALLFLAFAAGADAPPADDQKELEHLVVRQQAPTFEALVQKTKPRWTWGENDMLWVEHDEKGKVGFAMNRAYKLKLGKGEPVFVLLEADKDFYSRSIVDYTRKVDVKPMIIARDPQRGVVYRANWPSPTYDGTGRIELNRILFLLCDGQHRWHFIGEGPVETVFARNGASYCESSEVEAHVRWTDKPEMPVELICTETSNYDMLVIDDHEPAQLAMRREGKLVGKYPATVQWEDKPPYTITDDGQTLDMIVERVAAFLMYLPSEESTRKKGALASIKATILATNPGLAEKPKAGTRIVLDLKKIEANIPKK